MGQTGEPRPGKLADRATFDRPKRTVRDPVREAAESILATRPGAVPLAPTSRYPESVRPMREAVPATAGKTGGDMPPAARDLMRLAERLGRQVDAWVSDVRPTSARGRLSARTVRTVVVRVWCSELTGAGRRPLVVTRRWHLWLDRPGSEWQTGLTAFWRPWRGKAIPNKATAAQARKQIEEK